jgi:hypothetical protein
MRGDWGKASNFVNRKGHPMLLGQKWSKMDRTCTSSGWDKDCLQNFREETSWKSWENNTKIGLQWKCCDCVCFKTHGTFWDGWILYPVLNFCFCSVTRVSVIEYIFSLIINTPRWHVCLGLQTTDQVPRELPSHPWGYRGLHMWLWGVR